MMIRSLLPMMIMLVVLAILFFGVYKLRKFFTVKITHFLLIIYLGVLLLSAAAPFMADLDYTERVSESEAKINQEEDRIYQALKGGEIEKIDNKYLVDKQSFNLYQKSTLQVKSNGSDNPQIFVEKKPNEDGKIEAYVYTNRLSINGLDFTIELGKPFNYELTDNILTIHPSEQRNINVSIFKKEFTKQQIIGERIGINHRIDGIPALYLRIPANVEIIGEIDLSPIFVGD